MDGRSGRGISDVPRKGCNKEFVKDTGHRSVHTAPCLMSPGASQTDGGAAITGCATNEQEKHGEKTNRDKELRGRHPGSTAGRGSAAPCGHAKTFQRGPRVPPDEGIQAVERRLAGPPSG